ncbi:MAG: LacI family DNA-binding transcriptional regulator [Rhodobacteraceae bacterium]|nr:LacI family DNA-binding transcriptional regulator [Paracoccaceae bacterium]
MSRPTVHDIARTAGVSLATVDRVLNARPGVRAKTVARVQTAIRDLGYVRDISAANLARQRQYRLAFVLPEPATAFLSAVRGAVEGLAALAATERADIAIVDVPAFDPHAVARALHDLEGADGVALMAPDTPQVRDAVRRLKARGTVVVALVSDLSDAGRDHFAGINNIAAGRTAGLLMGRFVGPGQAGSIAVIAGSMLARDHVERRKGFDDVLQSDFPRLRALPSVEGRDDAQTVARLLPPLLDRVPDLRGIYSIGAGNRGLVAVLKERRLAGRITVIAHELTPLLRGSLVDGTVDAVISQDVGHVVRSALRVLKAKADGVPIIAAQERIRIDVFLRENLLPSGGEEA